MQFPSRPPPARPPTILCVDDERAALFLRQTLLEGAGYHVYSATHAAQALRIFRGRKIDLVISDHLLPGISGTDMAHKMKEFDSRIPILLLSGVPDQPQGTEYTDKFLGKGEGPEKLLETIAGMLRYRRFHLREGAYSAEISCDTAAGDAVWHCVIQRAGSAEILSWSQSSTEKTATAAAKKQLAGLCRQDLCHRSGA